MTAPRLRATFNQPFTEQVAAFRLRLGDLVPTARWDDISGAAHDRAFMVAGAMKADLLADLAAAVDRAVAEGVGLETFRADFRAIVERRGWHGWTGEGTKRGEAWRTRVIYRTNLATSYAAGRMAQLTAGDFPLWVYRHGGSREPRPQHLAWDGLVLPPEHPFWATHAPPNGWGCSCYVVGARSPDGARRRGGDPEIGLPQGWNDRDPRTGAPPGIDRGWAHAPGGSPGVGAEVAALAAKAVDWDYSLAVAFMRGLPASRRDDLSRAYRGLPSLGAALSAWAGTVAGGRAGAAPQRTLGLATASQIADWRARLATELEGLQDIAVDAAAVRHAFRRHGDEVVERRRGQRALQATDFGRLPQLVDAPDSVVSAETAPGRGPRLRFARHFGDERLVALFEARTGRRRIMLVTMWVERVGAPPTATP